MFPMCRAMIFAAGLRLLVGGRAETVPSFDQPELSSQNGSAVLEWAGEADRYEVQHARAFDFSDAEVIYVGSIPSAHVSGLRDGEHLFRVRASGATTWSDPAVLRVEHHSMLLVWPLMALGAGVFLATAGFVARHASARGRST
jgi:hypothetical protein